MKWAARHSLQSHLSPPPRSPEARRLLRWHRHWRGWALWADFRGRPMRLAPVRAALWIGFPECPEARRLALSAGLLEARQCVVQAARSRH